MKIHKEDSFHLGVKALILNAEHKVLLLERHHPIKGIYWDLPGGRLQKGESQIDTLLREVREETGLSNVCEVHPFMMALTDIRIQALEEDVGLIFSIFLINLSESFDPILSEEHVDFEWCSLSNAAEKLTKQYPSAFIEKMIRLDPKYSPNLIL
jgi:8-oxo-dGTP pyrophosphatase MutT (NUDIX family)